MCSWTGRLTIVKRSILSKVIYTFNAIPIEIPMFLAEIERSILKLIWNLKGHQTAKTILKIKKVEGLILPDFKTSYKASEIKTVWYWHKERHRDQRNRIKSPEIKSYIYGKRSFDNSVKNIQWRKDSLINKWCWETGYSQQRNEVEHYLMPCTKNNSRWINSIHVRPKTIKLSEENI